MNKRELTKLFLEQVGTDSSEEAISEFLPLWWVTPFSPIGLRLSTEGNNFLKKILKLQHYSYKIKEDTVKTLKLYLLMSKYLSSPYYLQGQNTIVIYGEQDAIMLSMLNGDIAQYLENFTR